MKFIKIFIFFILLFGGYKTTGRAIQDYWPLPQAQGRLPYNQDKDGYLSDKKLVSEFIGDISAYTLGRSEENDSDPCIGAFNDDLCSLAQSGAILLANNYYLPGTIACIETIGCGNIADRMNPRYGRKNFDIAGLDYKKNIEFGRKKLIVRIYK